jgi:hypothetical protein
MTIDEICRKYDIRNYTINDDGTIDVDGYVDLYKLGLEELPLVFNKVTGNFIAQHNPLKNLKGSPRWVGGYFDTINTMLTSLEGSPEHIEDDFMCSFNDITDLTGSPKYVGGFFHCGYNEKLINPKGCTEKIGQKFTCDKTPIGSIFNDVDQFFLHAFNFYKIIKDDTVNLKRLKYVMDLYDQYIYLEDIEKYYRIV